MKTPQTKQQAVDMLRSGCEQCVACLIELVAIHLEMDPPDRMIQPSDAECVYRLRKALLHVKAITSWQFDTDIMHVIAPDLRAANEQINNVWKKMPRQFLADHLAGEDKPIAAQAQRSEKTKQEIVSSFIHPTPQRLLLPVEQGGLGKVDEVRYFYNMFVLLGDLVLRYGISLGYLSQLLKGKSETPIALILKNIGTTFGSISPKHCLAFEKPIDGA